MKLEHSKTLKNNYDRLWERSIHHLIKFIPNLAEITEPLRLLLKKRNNKDNRLNWNEKHSKAFEKIKQKVKQIIENKHFDTPKKTGMKSAMQAIIIKHRTKTR